MAMVKCKECGAEVSNKAKQCPNCGKRKMGVGKIIGIVIAVLIVLAGLSAVFEGCSARVSAGSSDFNTNEQQQNTSNTSEENTGVVQNEQVPNPDNIKIKSADFGTNYSGDKLVYITYEWTNNDDAEHPFFTTYTAKTYQDGIELHDGYYSGYNGDLYADQNNVKSGKTQTFTKAYKLSDNKHDVDVEITEWISFDDKVIVSKSFKIE